MIKSKNLKTIVFFIGLSIAMSAYLALMGKSSNRATAVAMHDFTLNALSNWHHIADTLNIPLSNTKPDMLHPVVRKGFSALDLVIYGHEIVEPEYQKYYQELSMPQMIGQLFIPNDENGKLRYMVGGVQLLSIQAGKEDAAFFIDVPTQVINEASLLYDSIPISGGRDGSGVVRYDRLDDGRYVMGFFINQTNVDNRVAKYDG
ncbi:hypothetical protein [Teredinibacter purpureus]|uniref:hypothetical protein n=1 Tax=Teredinibacter purpureus TaxID=2731756 RepID=UPI0005F7702B|nr:hypothetical protein [Teredinibacter purpureus]